MEHRRWQSESHDAHSPPIFQGYFILGHDLPLGAQPLHQHSDCHVPWTRPAVRLRASHAGQLGICNPISNQPRIRDRIGIPRMQQLSLAVSHHHTDFTITHQSRRTWVQLEQEAIVDYCAKIESLQISLLGSMASLITVSKHRRHGCDEIPVTFCYVFVLAFGVCFSFAVLFTALLNCFLLVSWNGNSG